MPPKSKKGGGKNRRRGKADTGLKRELEFKEDGQEYAQVKKMLGNGRLTASCIDGKERLCHIRGKMRKKVWVMVGDVILVSLRDFQDQKGDVILKYTAEEARNLKQYGELPDHVTINETKLAAANADSDDDDNIEFDEEIDGEIDLADI